MAASPQATGGVTLSFTEDRPGYKRISEHISNADQLITRLHEIQANRTSELLIGVNVNDKSNNGLAIGLGDDKWAVLWGNAEATELFYSVGDASAQGDIELYFEQWDILPRKCFVRVDKAMQVIRTWFASGELSKEIQWERKSLLPSEGG